jgi:two-component system chemotaxis sensor kinase CheA
MAEGGGRDGGTGDKARDEFLSEAQELVDGLGRDLLNLDEGLKRDQADPELINEVFRGVHTLKGLSGLFGATRMAGLSHELEDVLDDLRLGRIELTVPVLDLLFQAVALYARILAAEHGAAPDPGPDLEKLLVSLSQFSGRRGGGGTAMANYELDAALLGVLTEYEEHRLRTNIQQGLRLYRIRVRFSLATIDTALDELKAKARPLGEIITYLPTGTSADIDTIELEILMASRSSLGQLQGALEGPEIAIEEVRRRVAVAAELETPAPPDAPLSKRPPSMTPSKAPRARSSLAPPPPDPVHQRHTASLVPPPGGGGQDLSLRSVSQTVRVDIRKLDRLMTVVGELAIVKTAIARLTERVRARRLGVRELSMELARLNRTFERQLAQMQGGILEVRMVPLGQAFDKLARVVRQISREHSREVNLVITGAETEIDKLIVEELSDPLMHMIRNGIDHGIERREDRLAVGKPAAGTIALNAFQKGNHVVIEVEDDGRGMDPVALLAAGVRRGLVTKEEAKEMQTGEILNLVFMPGFTTKEVATDISGRGVGLDVVKTNISKLGGIVDVVSDVGIGTKITITLPITLAIINVLLVHIGDRLFAIPLANVEEAISLDERQLRNIEGREVLTVRGVSLPTCRLGSLFELPPSPTDRPRSFIVIAQVGNRRLGLIVDGVVGQQDIVIKSLGKTLKGVRGFAGATELGDQRVALVIDVAAVIEEVLAAGEGRFSPGADAPRRRGAKPRPGSGDAGNLPSEGERH